ncbi:MAG: hypothetical protein CL678_14290 [Bdellovibrionaceae bacterium]|nr:hypothetical protein [Pseudobdellovibrionaceae bacterium]|tara:strand:- start:357 stop:1616 length:1260 start_codon:yes stop_codon:yes gene_type:complete
MFRKLFLSLVLSLCAPLYTLRVEAAENVRDLSELLRIAYENNGQLSAAEAVSDAESALVASSATPEDPMIGVSQLNRGNETQYAVISQKLRFPVKYFAAAKMQSRQADSKEEAARAEKWKLRRTVSHLYYSIYSKQKLIQLTEANRQAVKEFARVAERKYAANQGTQGDSMKAHFEITQLDLELIRLRQEEDALQQRLKAALGERKLEKLVFGEEDLGLPRADLKTGEGSGDGGIDLENAPQLSEATYNLESAQWASALSKWEYAPDFQFQFQQRIAGQPLDSQIYSVSLSFPLFFWKKSSNVAAASYRRDAMESKVTQLRRDLEAKVKDLKGRVEVGEKTLKIYETSLIPQARGAYNSAKSAYQAGKTSFLNLLDSERSLYRVRTGFYRALESFVADLTELEAELGIAVSDLEKKDEN